ncbi:MAG: serine hydrolase domain-containing protein, partial [Bacteroidota bacterium]
MKNWFYLILFLSITNGLLAQTRFEKIDDLVTFCQDNNMFNGNILVAEKGKIIYQQSVGQADFDNNIPLNDNTSFCLGSISKQFTAFAIMLLKQQGKLEYSTTIGEIFPEFPKYMHDITLKNLIQHTSGLKRTHYGEQDGLKNEEIYQNFIKAKGEKLLFKSGTDLRYSNSGFMMLAMVVEKVSGQSFESFLTENAWKPLGMTNTYVMSEEDYNRHNRAIGFDGFGKKDDFNVLTYGSNGIYSTTGDLCKWMQSFNTDLLMDLEDRSEAWQPATTNDGKLLPHSVGGYQWYYGFGLYLGKDNLQGMIGHSGAYGGFFNAMLQDLKNERSVVILTNNGRILPVMDMAVIVQKILSNDSYTLPKVSIDLELRKKHYNDIDAAIQYYHQLKKDHPSKYKFDNEWELNRLAYALMHEERYEDAIKIIKLL